MLGDIRLLPCGAPILPGTPAKDTGAITFHELLNKAEEGDQSAVEALAKQALHIGRGLGPIIAGLSPRVILIAGDITSAWHRFGPDIEKEAAKLVLAGSPSADSAHP